MPRTKSRENLLLVALMNDLMDFSRHFAWPLSAFLRWKQNQAVLRRAEPAFVVLTVFVSLGTGGGGGDSSTSGLHMSQETPSLVVGGRGGGPQELCTAAEPRGVAVGRRAEQLRQAGGQRAEAVSAVPHHGVAAEQTGCCSGRHVINEGQEKNTKSCDVFCKKTRSSKSACTL